MAAAGVKLAFDMTEHSLIGFSDALKNYFKFRRLFRQLRELAIEREPDTIICVDFAGFNRRFAHTIRQYARSRLDWFQNWNPKIIQYVSPQVWASREGRAQQIARDYDLLLSIFPFEKDWYAKKAPRLTVEFVGHPVVDRYAEVPRRLRAGQPATIQSLSPTVLLLPGSRPSEIKRHLPVMRRALAIMRASNPSLQARMVLPNAAMVEKARETGLTANLKVQAGDLAKALAESAVAISKTGTVSLECAYFGVPAVAMYKASWINYQIAKSLVKVKYAAMPNLLAGAEVFPEFIQDQATPENIAEAALELLRDETRLKVKMRLEQVAASLGPPGASRRAARAVLRLLEPSVVAARPRGDAVAA
jgi:lipid-A-disaccharide synthase